MGFDKDFESEDILDIEYIEVGVEELIRNVKEEIFYIFISLVVLLVVKDYFLFRLLY